MPKQERFEQPCEVCGKVMSLIKSRLGKARTCSYACSNALQSQKVESPCVICGFMMTSSPSTVRKTCSKECWAKLSESQAYVGHKTRPCAVCGELIRGSESKLSCKSTCGPICRDKLRAAKYTSKPCVICGKGIVGAPSHVSKRVTCSYACMGELAKRRGADRPKSDKMRFRVIGYKKIAASLIEKQKGKCASCGETGVYGRVGINGKLGLVLDHDHSTGVVREIICHQCNTALGHLDDSPSKVRMLLKYIEKHKQLKLVAG